MKIILTESKLKSIVYKYLDNQDFIKVEEKNSVFFFNTELDKFAQIRVDMDDNFCEMSFKIVEEISSFFSIHRDDSLYYISHWAADKLGLKPSEYFAPKDYYRSDMALEKTRRT